MEDFGRSPARLIVPVAIAAVFVAMLVVLISSGGDGDSNATGGQPGSSVRGSDGRESGTSRRSYRIKSGDTLDGISQKTGVSTEDIQELNPGLDPEALVSGQRIKLRR